MQSVYFLSIFYMESPLQIDTAKASIDRPMPMRNSSKKVIVGSSGQQKIRRAAAPEHRENAFITYHILPPPSSADASDVIFLSYSSLFLKHLIKMKNNYRKAACQVHAAVLN